MDKHKSPYLSSTWRLADVLATIQIMGAYAWASRKTEDWSEKLGTVLSAAKWEDVFKDHPEFFRVTDSGWVSLRWRHGYDRTFDRVKGRELSRSEVDALPSEQKDQMTRKPLNSDQIEALLKTAIELHTRAVAYAQERRWLTPLLFGLLGIVIGGVLQAALK